MADFADTKPTDDLSALAWVHSELRRSLDNAHKALRRYLKESETATRSDLDTVDPAPLRAARTQLHQGVGALELVGMPAAARVLRAAEAAVQRLMNKTALVDEAAVHTIERVSFALLDYLARRLAGKPTSPVGLFPQYAAVQALAGADRVNPADLWEADFAWHELPAEPGVRPRTADDASRGTMEAIVLRLMRRADAHAWTRLSDLCAELAAGAPGRGATLWRLAAAFAEAEAAGLLPQGDVHTKRVAARLLAQLRLSAKRQDEPSERLAQDLLFFSAHARPSGTPTPRLNAVRRAWHLSETAPLDYENERLGRFDPALIAQARKRVAGAKDLWSAVAGGELHRLPGLPEQVALMGDSVDRLFPGGAVLSKALQDTAVRIAATGVEPPAPLAMEVATSVLYVDAVLEDGELDQPDLAPRLQRLAQRITELRDGGEPQPLEPWMEELYRRVSDRQTMGSVVQELRASLSEIEKQIDQYFRNPVQRELLIPVPNQLSAMRGVLSVLGMDQASAAVLFMRDDVDALASTEVDPQQAIKAGTFDRLADNLGALSFLIDMLSVQPHLVKSLFRFDPHEGTLTAVMGQSERPSAFGGLDETQPEPLVDEAKALADSLSERPDADHVADHTAELESLSQRALAADLPAVAGAVSSAQRALAQAPDASARQAVAAELAQTVGELASVAPVPVPSPPPAPLPPGAGDNLEDDAEMREIFLEEAREVIGGARASLEALRASPEDVTELTTVRRAFHTLKGSSRMVGLRDYGDAAWACEQLYNARLAQSPRMDADLDAVSRDALDHLWTWTDAIAQGHGALHTGGPIVTAADTLRVQGRRQRIAAVPPAQAPETAPAQPPAQAPVQAPALDLPVLDTPALPELKLEWPADDLLAAPPAALPLLPIPELDFGGDLPAAPPADGPPSLTERVPDLPLASDLDLAAPALPVEAPAFALDLGGDEALPALLLETVPVQPLTAAVPEIPPLADVVEIDFKDFEADAAAPAVPMVRPATNESVEILPMLDDAEALPIGEVTLPLEGLAPDRADFLAPEVVPAEPLQPIELRLDDLPEWAAATPPQGLALPVVASSPLPEPAAVDSLAPSGADDDEEPVKLIGDLRIPIPLFNIYLNEADELSRRLSTELAEWSVEHERRPVSESSVVLAHSLAGSSATVGYAELSGLARALEHTLMRSAPLGPGRAEDAQLFSEAAEEIRRLLHQFAAGFLRPMVPGLVERLHAAEQALALRASASGDDPGSRVGLEAALEAAAESQPMPLATDVAPPADVPQPLVEPFQPSDLIQFDPPLADQPLPDFAAPLAATVPSLATTFAALTDLPEAIVRPARSDAFDDEEDIEAVDAIDAELFPIFEEEAEELLPQLQARLREWALRPSDADAPSACMRTLHTFKGGARLAGAMRLGEMAHRLETAIEHLGPGQGMTPDQIEPLLVRADHMVAAYEALRRSGAGAGPAAPAAPAQPIAIDLESAFAGLDEGPTAAADGAARSADHSDAAASAAAPHDLPAAPPGHAAATIDWSRFDGRRVQGVIGSERTDRPGAASPAVRVRASLLDRLVNHAGEVSITRARIDADVRQLQGAVNDMTDNLERMRAQLRDIELQAESQIASRIEAAKTESRAFDPLEMDRFTRFQELTRFMAESVNDVATVQRSVQRTLQSAEDELAAQARLTRELQDDLLRTRMIEFESLADRLYRVVRQAAKDTAKQVRLDIVGGSIEVDRGVLERMVGPFEHLLRNCVAHGIESPDRRVAAGKDPSGEIRITVTQEGNEIGVDCRDDGGGLDLARIRSRAEERGLLDPGQETSDAELANLIFRPGFSTASEITELAGRGVGLDVVRAEVNAMGGRIETASTPGQGTSFKLVLPLTTAVTQVVMLRCGGLQVAVPSTLIEIVRRVPTAQVETAYAQGALAAGDTLLPFYWLGALLLHSVRGATVGRAQAVVVVRSAAQRVALHVDEVQGNEEVVVKHVGPQLARLPGLAGVTILPSGAVALIYNPVALAALYAESARELMREQRATREAADTAAPAAPVPQRAPLVLVVDDSLTVRRVTQRMLVREGYRVALAKDGLDAIEKLAQERPSVMLSDIEMPRMDGFDLVRNVRADPALGGLPVIMITSRIAQKHRDYAAELGVDHYLGKPYAEEELLQLVARYARAAVPA